MARVGWCATLGSIARMNVFTTDHPLASQSSWFDMNWKPSKIVGAILGVFATLPLSVWGFVIGGDFIGAWTSGWLAIPGALFGAGLVIFAGAFLGSTAVGTASGLFRKLRHGKRP